MSYNGTWEIIHTIDQITNDTNDTPPVIGNGKIAIIPSFDGKLAIKKAFITQDGPYASNAGNTLETFNTGLINVYTNTNSDPDDISTSEIKLNMYNAIIAHKLTNQKYTIDSDLYVNYNYPFATINTKTFTTQQITEFTIQHEIHAPSTLI